MRQPQIETEVVDPRAPRNVSLDNTDYAVMSRRLALNLDDAQRRDLAEAMPHVEVMLAHLRRDRPYTDEPSLIFRYADSDTAEAKSDV